MGWYYKRENEVCGPFAAGDIRQLIERKTITSETELTQAPEGDEWLPAGESEFAECFQPNAQKEAKGGSGSSFLWAVTGFWASILVCIVLSDLRIVQDFVILLLIAGPFLFAGTVKLLASLIVGGMKLLTGMDIDSKLPTPACWSCGLLGLLLLFFLMTLSSGSAKPVIYLYPEREMDVRVQLDYDGRLDTTYPAYPEGGWFVTARPDGTLINKTDGREYSYLFWDGFYDNKFDFSKGFIVKGADTARFLQDTLAAMGLTPREYNEFIVYWLPKMRNNAYNLIAFQGAEYTDHARLTITPEPDSLLRVFMAFKSAPVPYPIPPQTFPRFERRGFTAVEWGGCDAGARVLGFIGSR